MNGIINVLKPPGMMSNGVVVYLRRILGQKKIGHTGTLDPGAAGVLPICVGKSTRLSDIIMNNQKTYIAQITFGIKTDTADAYGKLLQKASCDISLEMLSSVLPRFIGEIKQQVPMYSAAKVDGQKLYKLAYKGKQITPPVKTVSIYSIDILEKLAPNTFMLKIACSRGTYIRTLCEDLGKELGAIATMTLLIRTASGGFNISDSYTLDELKTMSERHDFSFLAPPQSALDYEVLRLPPQRLKQAINGMPSFCNAQIGKTYSVYCGDIFVGIGQAQDEQGIKIKTLLYD